MLARERQELARANISNARLEQRIIELEQMLHHHSTTSQNQENNSTTNDSVNSLKSVSLKLVPGDDGHCKRCEAFVIANGVQNQKIKSLKSEITKLKARLK